MTIVAPFGQWLDVILVLMAVVAFFGSLLGGLDWLQEWVLQPVTLFGLISLAALIPLSLVFLPFRTMRGLAGSLLTYSSHILGFWLWVGCLGDLMLRWGRPGAIAGFLAGGVGVVPFDFIAALIQRDWLMAVSTAVIVVIVWIMRMSGVFLIAGILRRIEAAMAFKADREAEQADNALAEP